MTVGPSTRASSTHADLPRGGERGAAAIMLVPQPSVGRSISQDDVVLTRRVAAAGILMGIDVDHVVLADALLQRMREKGVV